MLWLDSFALFRFKSGLAERGLEHKFAFRAHDHLLLPCLSGQSSLLNHLLTLNLLRLYLLHLDLKLSLFFLLATESLLLFPLLLGVLPLQPVFLFLDFAFVGFLTLSLLEVANEALAANLLTLVALPDALRHALQVRTKQVVRFVARAAIDEVARVLTLEAVVRVLLKQKHADARAKKLVSWLGMDWIGLDSNLSEWL